MYIYIFLFSEGKYLLKEGKRNGSWMLLECRHRSTSHYYVLKVCFFFRARLKTVVERFLLYEKRETYVFGVNCMQAPANRKRSFSIFVSFLCIHIYFQPAFPCRGGRGGRESDSVPITGKRLNVS